MKTTKTRKKLDGRGEATRKRLLDSAESLFASKGYLGVTIRDVAKASRSNVAAAHYHFGSKEGLGMEMLRNRIAPVNEKRLQMLADSRKKAQGKALQPNEIFEALLLPLGRAASRREGPDLRFMQLIGRSFTEPALFMEKVHKKLFRELPEIFMIELRKAFPDSSEEDLFWNLHFVVAAMLGTLAQHRRLGLFSGGVCDERDIKGMIHRLVTFAAGGFCAGVGGNDKK